MTHRITALPTTFVIIAALAGSMLSCLSASVAAHAESGVLGSEWAVSNTSSPAYITITTTGGGDNPGSANRVASYSVTFPAAGEYQLYARVRVDANSPFDNDSLFYAASFGVKSPTAGGDWVTVNGLGNASGFINSTDVVTAAGTAGNGVWKWLNLSLRPNDGVSEAGVAVTVLAGNLTQTFQVGAREDGLDIDKLLFGTAGYTFTVAELDAGGPGTPPPPAGATIDLTKTYQTIEGLGGAICFYNGWFRAHPYKEEIYSNAFAGLNLSMLRLANWYRYQSDPNFDLDAKEFVAKANSYLGRPVPVFMSSWAPPAFLKSNGEVANGGSLVYTNGGFVYNEFAEYWYDALVAYEALGVKPTWISIQNEPDWVADYDSCIFKPNEEGTNYASYSIALDRVHQRLTSLPSPPKLLAPEVVHVSYNTLQNYAATMNPNSFYGVAHHLYGDGGGTGDSFLTALRAATNIFPSKPRFMTEYGDVFDMIECAILIHNSLVVESVSGYNHWNLLWPFTTGGLIQIENPWTQSSWTNAPAGTPTQSHGWWYSPSYWSMKHFSYFIQPGFKRVSATNSDANVLSSAYLSADGLRLVTVLINRSAASPSTLDLNFGGFQAFSSSVHQTAGTNKFKPLGPAGSQLVLPPQSLTTVVLDKYVAVGPAGNPSPAHNATNIQYDATLGWSPGSNASVHAVYLGLSSNAVAQATPASPEFKGTATTNSLVTPLSWSTTYFWRVDEIAGANTNTGPVWSFTTAPPKPLPPPWLSQNIGSLGLAGLASYDNGVFTATASGADIQGTADAFRLVYVPITGDCSIIARVSSVQNINAWSKAGVMIRENLNANAANAFVALTPGNGVTWQYRSSAGGGTTYNNTAGFNAPYWVRLVRSGTTFTGYRSPDGANWTQQGTTTISMSAGVYVGLALTSHNNASLCLATFDNVTLPGWPALPGISGSLTASPGDAWVTLNWSAISAATSYNLKRGTTNGGPYSLVTNVPATSYTDIGLNNGTIYYYVVSGVNIAGESTNSLQAVGTPEAPPALEVSQTGTDLVITWPLETTGYTVQSCTNLALGSWETVSSPPPEIIGGKWQVTLPVLSTLPATFLRLVK